MGSNKQYRKERRLSRLFQVLAIGLLLCVIGVTALGCSGQLLGEETTTAKPVETTAAETETTGFTVGGVVDPLAFMEGAEHTMYAEFLNTGKSDSILIRMDDQVILVDTGDDDDYNAIKAKLDGYGINTIDYLIITHYDNDHIGAADDVLKNYTVKMVYAPDYVRNSGEF